MSIGSKPQQHKVLTQTEDTATYDPKQAQKFRYNGKTFQIKSGGPSVEQIIAEDRGRCYE